MRRAAELVSHRAVTQSYIYPSSSGHAFLADDMLDLPLEFTVILHLNYAV